jgi:hypothetical protein
MAMDGQMESLLEYADKVSAGIGTKWAALDILDDGGQWRLLETSLLGRGLAKAVIIPSSGQSANGPACGMRYLTRWRRASGAI